MLTIPQEDDEKAKRHDKCVTRLLRELLGPTMWVILVDRQAHTQTV